MSTESLIREVKKLGNNSSTGLTENVAGALCYLFGVITGIIFLLIEKNSKFVRYHAMQSILVWIAFFIISTILGFIPILGWIISILLWPAGILLWLYCMFKAYQGSMFELPWIGKIAREQMSRMP